MVTLMADGENTTKLLIHEPVGLSVTDRLQLWADSVMGRKSKPFGYAVEARKSP